MTEDTPTLLGIPLNRIVAFIGPYVAVGSGAVADWLLVHVHFLSLFHTTHTSVASAITQVVVFGVTALLTWLGHQKWLEGYQAWAYGKHTAFPANLVPPDGPYDPNEFGPVDPPNTTSGTGNAGVGPVADGGEFPTVPPGVSGS